MVSTLTPEGIQDFLRSMGMDGPTDYFPLADICTSPITIYFSYLATTLIRLSDCEAEAAWDSIQWSSDLSDLVVVVPRLRLQSINPYDFAFELQKKFPTNSLFEHPFQDEFNLRFIFNSGTLSRLLIHYILDRGPEYGKYTSFNPQSFNGPGGGAHNKVIVEFSSPNLGREFNGGHLRSTFIGMNIASMYESMGWDVVKLNYLGDWGQHIGLLVTGWPRFGSEESFASEPLRHLLQILKQMDGLYQSERHSSSTMDSINGPGIVSEKDACCRRLEEGSSDDLALWQRFRDASIARYMDVYARLGVTFDEYSGESDFSQETIVEIESALKEKGAYEESDGAWIINFKKLGFRGIPNAILRYRNGSTTYLMRDIAAYLKRNKTHSFDKMLYVAPSKQDAHFQQLFAVLALLGYQDIDTRLKHISFGSTGFSVPTAKTSGLLLEDIIDYSANPVNGHLVSGDESSAKLSGIDPSMPKTLGVANLMMQCLAHRHATSITMDIEKNVSSGTHTGTSLHRRYSTLCLKLKDKPATYPEFDNASVSIFEQEEYANILRLLIQYPDIVKTSFGSATLESSTIVTYLFRVIGSFSTLSNDSEVPIGSATTDAEMALFECIRQVLENGMRMLGILPLIT